MYFSVNGAKYWIMLGPSGPALYRREGAKTKYLGRQPLEEIRRLLAQAGAEALQKIKSEVETVKQALEQKPTQTSQPSQQLTWKKDGHTYWILHYGRSFYIYVKGPSTRHKPRLVEKSDISGVIGRLVAAGALHVLEALRRVVNGLHAAVSDLLKPAAMAAPAVPAAKAREASKNPQTPPNKPQAPAEARQEASRREAEDAFRELRRELSRAVKKWDEEWRMKTRDWGGPDREWLRERLSEFIDENMHLLEKILPHPDLKNKFADAAVELTYGYLTRSDVLEALKEL